MPKPVEVTSEEVAPEIVEPIVVAESLEPIVIEGEQPDANALAVAAHEQSMAVLASRGMLTDSHVINLSLRN